MKISSKTVKTNKRKNDWIVKLANKLNELVGTDLNDHFKVSGSDKIVWSQNANSDFTAVICYTALALKAITDADRAKTGFVCFNYEDHGTYFTHLSSETCEALVELLDQFDKSTDIKIEL